MATRVDDQGDIATTADDRCTRVEYARNPGANLVDRVSRTETVGVACATTPSRPADVISDARTAYDGLAVGAPPTRGLPTAQQRAGSYNGATPVYVTEATTTYDAHGRALSAADALGRTTTTAYTPATGGPVTSTTTTSPDPDGTGSLTAHVTIADVNPAWGAPTRVTDANNKVTTATYDALGRITAVWLPGRAQGTKSANTTYAYAISTTGVNAVTTKTLTAAEGYLTSVALYDGLLRSRQTQSPSADRDVPGRVVTDIEYDSRGLSTATNGQWFTTGTPAGTLIHPATVVPSRTEVVYDGVGRATAEIFKVEGTERWRTTTTYGGDRVSVDPPTGAVPTTTIADARGQTVELRQFLGAGPAGANQATTYAYDDAGRLAGVTDAAGNDWTYGYDLRGRQVTSSDPDKGTTTTTYDDAGQVLTVTDARGETLANVYDNLGRRVQLRDDTPTGALRASWAYDTLAKGQPTSSTRYESNAAYVTAVTAYDDGYRPLGQSVTIPNAEGALAGTYTTTYAYMPNGQPKSTRLPSAGGLPAETVTTQYDAASMPMRAAGGVGWAMYQGLAEYDVYGKLEQSILGSTYFIYVGQVYETGTNRLTGTWVNREVAPATYDLNATYAYDDAGNPTSAVDNPTSGAGDAQCFGYDGLRRLTQAWTPADANCATAPSTAGLGGAAPYWFTDTFDPVGNRTERVAHEVAGDTTHTYTYPTPGTSGAHTLTAVTAVGPHGTLTNTYGYDDAGNTTTRAVGEDPAQTLTWDPEGELTTLAATGSATDSYLYTADGDRLIRRQDGTTTVYLPGGEELTLAAGQVKATRYYSFNGQTVAVRTGIGNANVWTLVPDGHGTAQLAIRNSTSAVTRKYTDPYGNPRGTTPTTWTGDHGYLDKPEDTTGLTQIGARYYDSDVGRFISVDPVMDLADPQQWHGYAYANNNPITYSDPSGLITRVDDEGQKGSRRANKATTQIAARPPSLREKFQELKDADDRAGFVALDDTVTAQEAARVDEATWRTISDDYSNYTAWLQTCAEGGCAVPCPDNACEWRQLGELVLWELAGFGLSIGIVRLLGGAGTATVAPAANTASEVAAAAPRVVHGNSASSPATAYLYRLSSAETGYLKTGISQNPMTRYSQTFMQDKTMEILQSGTRREMLNLERFIVERDPGPLNFERWAGQFAGDVP
jgi:RHS repeat-associated protein